MTDIANSLNAIVDAVVVFDFGDGMTDIAESEANTATTVVV